MISNDITKRKLPPLNSDKIETKSPKKKSKSSSAINLKSVSPKNNRSSDIGRVLESVKEDIVAPYTTQSNVYTSSTPVFMPFKGEDYYLEGARKFKKTRASEIDGSGKPVRLRSGVVSNSLASLYFHTSFKTVSLLLSGLLGGIMFWQLCSIYGSNIPIYTHYRPLSHPLHCVYYFATAFSFVAALDRYDFTLSFSEVLNRILSCYKLTPFFLIIINFLGMTTSLSNLYWDLKFDRRVENSSYVEDDVITEGPIEWQALNIVRALAAMIAWLLISLNPLEDKFTSVLNDLRSADETETQD